MEDNSFKFKRKQFLEDFEKVRPAMTAIGDVVRQGIIITLIETGGRGGIRVGEIQKRTNISRSAVSHHMKILKDAGIIDVRQDGTKIFYYLNPASSSLKELSRFWEQVEPMMELCHKKSQEEMKV